MVVSTTQGEREEGQTECGSLAGAPVVAASSSSSSSSPSSIAIPTALGSYAPNKDVVFRYDSWYCVLNCHTSRGGGREDDEKSRSDNINKVCMGDPMIPYKVFRTCSVLEKQRSCPVCFSRSTIVPVVYGFPSNALMDQYRKGLVQMGGDYLLEGAAVWACNNCRGSFHTYPYRCCSIVISSSPAAPQEEETDEE
jgi:hypothetical protein